MESFVPVSFLSPYTDRIDNSIKLTCVFNYKLIRCNNYSIILFTGAIRNTGNNGIKKIIISSQSQWLINPTPDITILCKN